VTCGDRIAERCNNSEVEIQNNATARSDDHRMANLIARNQMLAFLNNLLKIKLLLNEAFWYL
jgi:hypothetical protein